VLRPPDIADEVARLAALVDYGLSPDQGIVSLRPIVEIAAQMFRVPFSAVNMVGDDHVFFVTESAADKYDRSRRLSFCAHAIASDEVMVVEDASADIRFHDNPMVTNGQVRFYAGAAVRSAAGHALGALCLVDRKPHHDFDDQARARLRDLAGMIE
jgi:GAF domain-containing protein